MEVFDNMTLQIDKSKCTPFIISILVLVSCYPVRVYSSIWRLTLWIAIPLLALQYFSLRKKTSKLMNAMLIFFLINVFFTVYNGNFTSEVMYLYCKVLLYLFWCDLYCKRYTDVFLLSHKVIVGLIIIIQLYFQVVNPTRFGVAASGNYQNFLISDNFLGYYILPFMMLITISSLWKKAKIDISTWILLIICVLSTVISQAGACTVGICFYGVMILFSIWYKGRAKSSMTMFYIVYLLFFVGIVFFNVQYYASGFLSNVLGKDASFTGRTELWALAIYAIAQRPILAYGTMEGGRALVLWRNGAYHSCHNYFLSILIEGGVLQFLAYINMLRIVAQKLKNNINNIEVNIIATGILAMLVMYISEGELTIPAQYLIFFLAYYSEKFSNDNNSLYNKSIEVV